MNIFEDMCKVFDSNNEFIESKNSFFEKHNCGGEEVKVDFRYTIEDDKSGTKLTFGKCSKCNKVYYNVF